MEKSLFHRAAVPALLLGALLLGGSSSSKAVGGEPVVSGSAAVDAELVAASPQLYRAVYSGVYRDGTQRGTFMFNVENDTSGGAMTGRLYVDGIAARYSGSVSAEGVVSIQWALNSFRGTLKGQLAPDLSSLDGSARFWAAGRHYSASVWLEQTQ